MASSIAAVAITACRRAAAVQRWLPAPTLASSVGQASARQRSSVATLIPTSRDTTSIAALSGGNSRATIRSLYRCPYRATSVFLRPQSFRSYPAGYPKAGADIEDNFRKTIARRSVASPC